MYFVDSATLHTIYKFYLQIIFNNHTRNTFLSTDIFSDIYLMLYLTAKFFETQNKDKCLKYTMMFSPDELDHYGPQQYTNLIEKKML